MSKSILQNIFTRRMFGFRCAAYVILTVLLCAPPLSGYCRPQDAQDGRASRPSDSASLADVHAFNLQQIELAELVLRRPASVKTQAVANNLKREHQQNEQRLEALGAPLSDDEADTQFVEALDAETKGLTRIAAGKFESAYLEAMTDRYADFGRTVARRAPLAHESQVRTYLLQTAQELKAQYSQLRSLQKAAIGL